MKPEFAQKLLNKVTADYNRIASTWSIKRWKVPSDILALAKYIEENDNILDLGCGNGYLFELFKDKNARYIGADVSENQIKICKEKYPEANFVITEPLNFPFTNMEFTKVFCLSTIHHIPSKELRIKFLSEIKRVLKKDGTLILTAWNSNSKMHEQWLQNKDVTKEESANFDEGDILHPFKNSEGENIANRYIHCFTENELKDLLIESGYNLQEVKVVTRGNGKFQNILAISFPNNINE